MEKQSSSAIAHYAKRMMEPSIGLFEILKEAFITSIKNGRLLIFITIIVLSFYTAMDFTSVFIFLPIARDFIADAALIPDYSVIEADPISKKAFLKDFRDFLTYCFAYFGFLSLLLIFAITASVHSSFEAYTGKVLSLRDMLLGVKGRWGRALKTSFWMGLISSAIGTLLFFGFIMVTFFSEGFGTTAVLEITAVFGAVYLFSLGTVAVVVAVVEEEFSGMKAIGEAGELMKGKKFQGFALTAVMLLSSWGLSAAFGFLERGISPKLENEKLAMVVGVAIGFPQSTVLCGLMLFGFVAFTVYYHECKQRKMEKEARAMYAPLAVVQF